MGLCGRPTSLRTTSSRLARRSEGQDGPPFQG